MGNYQSKKVEGEVNAIPEECPPLIFRRIRGKSCYSERENLLSWENLETFLTSISSAIRHLEKTPSEAVLKVLSTSKKTGFHILEFLRNKNACLCKTSRQEFMAEKLICNLKSKMDEIVFARIIILDECLSQDDKKLKINDVLEPCIFTMKMFKDYRSPSSESIIPVSEYFLRFCILYLEIVVLALSIVPSHQMFALYYCLPEMMKRLKRYKYECVKERLRYLYKAKFFVSEGNQIHAAVCFRDEFDYFGKGWSYTWHSNPQINSPAELMKMEMLDTEKFQRYRSQAKNLYESPFDKVIKCVQGLIEKLQELNLKTIT